MYKPLHIPPQPYKLTAHEQGRLKKSMMLIKNLVEQYIRQEDRWKVTLLAQWSQVMGDLGNRVTLEKIYNDKLILGVYDASWLQELYLLSPVLCKTINAHLDRERIKRLHFKQIVPRRTIKKGHEQSTAYSSRRTITLTKKEQAALETIQDQELQKALKDFLIRCYKEKT